mmetsp:Transcript_88253/g.248452  ORF Transcript_88253/g.248452 Transcript_88253/m.248452 type:complete len:220 (+) Transcript_88253:953-1612(+)
MSWISSCVMASMSSSSISFALSSSFASAGFSPPSFSPDSSTSSFFFSGSFFLGTAAFASCFFFFNSWSAFSQASQRSLNHADGCNSSTRCTLFCPRIHVLSTLALCSASCHTKRISSNPSASLGNEKFAKTSDNVEGLRSGVANFLYHTAFSSSVSCMGFSFSSFFCSSSFFSSSFISSSFFSSSFFSSFISSSFISSPFFSSSSLFSSSSFVSSLLFF